MVQQQSVRVAVGQELAGPVVAIDDFHGLKLPDVRRERGAAELVGPPVGHAAAAVPFRNTRRVARDCLAAMKTAPLRTPIVSGVLALVMAAGTPRWQADDCDLGRWNLACQVSPHESTRSQASSTSSCCPASTRASRRR